MPTLPTRSDAPITATERGCISRSRWRMLIAGSSDRTDERCLQDEVPVVGRRPAVAEEFGQRGRRMASRRDAIVDGNSGLVGDLPDELGRQALALDGVVQAPEHAGG